MSNSKEFGDFNDEESSPSDMNNGTRDNNHQKHLELAGIVKGVHAKLRRKFRDTGDFTKVWDEHCQDEESLSNYASAMHHLAVDHWTKKPETRIDWCRATCDEYFFNGGLAAALAKDERRAKKQSCTSESSQVDDLSSSYEKSDTPSISDYGVSPGYPNYARNSDNSDEFVLPSSLPDRFASYPAQKLPEAPPRSLNISLPAAKRHVSINEDHSPFLLLQSPGDKQFTPDPTADGPFHPPDTKQQNPLDKCKDFMFSMDMTPTSSQEQEQQEREREALDEQEIHSKYDPVRYNTISLPFQGRIRLLDVGSCFNPFLKFDEFLAVGIDISPAVESVLHCDFLHLETPEPLQLARDTIDTILSTLTNPVTRLPQDVFHIVVFSLLLEYFPSPYQRWVCCQKAHSLLMMQGLLLIITPDSGHQNKNAPMMKSWKKALEGMGFKRWRYVKQEHLHCMAYRKVSRENPTESSTLVSDIGPNLLYIPQDFSDPGSDPTDLCGSSMFSGILRTDADDEFIRDSFSELPDIMID